MVRVCKDLAIGSRFECISFVVIGWKGCCCRLEPLLQRIHDKRSAVLCPIIDMVSAETMSYWGGPATGVGSFWWSLHFKMMLIPDR